MASRYLLESSMVDGYLLEDSSGVLLTDETTATPSIPESMLFIGPSIGGSMNL